VATAIYTGIFTDTGSFRFSNTNLEAFTICQEMVALGVDPYQVAKHVYGTYSLGRIKLLNMALDSIELTANGKMTIMTLSLEMFRETRTQPEDGDGLINYARRIEDVRVAALIQELNGNSPGQYHVSLRSDGSVDVARIAQARGGGGHASAAGFSVTAPLADVKADLLRLAEQL
jgi:phosphoesterase RecJ-like protein